MHTYAQTFTILCMLANGLEPFNTNCSFRESTLGCWLGSAYNEMKDFRTKYVCMTTFCVSVRRYVYTRASTSACKHMGVDVYTHISLSLSVDMYIYNVYV